MRKPRCKAGSEPSSLASKLGFYAYLTLSPSLAQGKRKVAADTPVLRMEVWMDRAAYRRKVRSWVSERQAKEE